MKFTKILYLGGDIAQVSMISDLVQSGYMVILVDTLPTAPGRTKATTFVENSCEDGKAIYQSLVLLNIDFDDVYIYPSSERFFAAASFLSYALHKKYSNSYPLYQNKIASKQFLSSLSIPIPQFKVITNNFEKIGEKIQYPSVAKLAFDWGGRSVRLINEESDLISYIFDQDLGKQNPGILETFLDLPEITVGGALVNNLYIPLVAYQTLSKNESFELEYLLLNNDLDKQYKIAHTIVAKIMKNLNLEGQFLAANFFVDKSVRLLEFGPVISHLLANLTRIMGESSPLTKILNVVNGLPNKNSKKNGCWGSKVVYTQNDDLIFEKLEIYGRAKKVKGYKGCYLLRDQGYHFDRANGSNSPVVALSAVGQDINNTRDILDEVSDCVGIKKK